MNFVDRMKYILVAMLFNNALAQQQLGTIEITNPLSWAFKEKVIEIPFEDIRKKAGNISTYNIVIKDSGKGS